MCISSKRKELWSLSLKWVQGPTASTCRCHGADGLTVVFQSILKYCYSSPSPLPPPHEYARYWNDTQTATSPGRRNARTPPHPIMVLRWSVRLMDTYASLEAKRTSDVWEGIPRLKWMTFKQNILSQIGLCLNSLLLLEEGVRESVSCPLAC